MVKSLFAQGGRAVVADIPVPILRPGEVLIAPAFSVVSAGTETSTIAMSADPARIHDHDYPAPDGHRFGPQLRSPAVRWAGPTPRGGPPQYALIGYSLAGKVVDTAPDVTDLRPGDRVAASGSQCAHHAELVAIPRNLTTPVPDGVPLDAAAFVTLGTIAMQAVRLTQATFGSTIVMYGLGLLGLLGTQIAAAGGIYTVGLDLDPRRRADGLRFGAVATPDPTDEAAVTRLVHELTGGFGADGVVLGVVTTSNRPMNHAFELCRQKGIVVGLGAFGTEIDRETMVWNDVTLVMQLAYGPGRYDQVYEEGNVDYPIGYVRWTENRNSEHFLRLVAEGKVQPLAIQPERFAFADAPAAYERLVKPDRPPTLLFEYPEQR
jgi:threonine dehydrogenase-like Zn-dependent dehydrogenase